MAVTNIVDCHGVHKQIDMFGMFKKKNEDQESISFDSKQGRANLYATLFYQVQENPICRCCLHIFRDGDEHYHVANGLNADEIAKELYIAMNRSDIIRDAVVGAYNMCFKTDRQQDDIKGKSYTIRSLNNHNEGMVCYFSKDKTSLNVGKRTYHAEYAKSLAEFLLLLRGTEKPLRTVFAVSLLDEHNVLCLSDGNVDDIANSLTIASAYNRVIDRIIQKLSK